jgi:signal transduction histidine kinase
VYAAGVPGEPGVRRAVSAPAAELCTRPGTRDPHSPGLQPVTPSRIAVATGGTALAHLQILRAVSQAVNSSLDLDEVLDLSLHALTHVTGHELASLHLVSDDSERLLLRGERGLSERLREVNLVLPMGHGLIGGVAGSGLPRRLDDAAEAPDLLPEAKAAVQADHIRGFVCVPIRARDRVLGTLSLGRQTLRSFDDDEFLLLECTADQIGLALDNARLYSETRRQLEDLRRAQQALVRAERLSAVGELASGVAHEINNPLMIIQAQAHLLLEGGVTPPVQGGLRTIEAATRRVAGIVRDLIAFAEPSPPQRSLCVLADHAARVLALQDYHLRTGNIRVHTEFQEAPPVWADASQLHEVLFNLVRNARQAMADGGGVLTVRVAGITGGVRVEVEDDGPGIPAEHLPRLFTPFFTTKGPGEGRGLGLTVSHAMVIEHGGHLSCENRPEGGARFVLELPVGAPRRSDAASD